MGAWLIQVRAVNKAEVSGLSVWQLMEVAPSVSLRESRSHRSSWLEVMDISFEPIRMPGFKDEEVTTSWYLGKFGLILDGKASLSHALLLSMIPPRYPSYGHCQALLGSCDRWNCIQFPFESSCLNSHPITSAIFAFYQRRSTWDKNLIKWPLDQRRATIEVQESEGH